MTQLRWSLLLGLMVCLLATPAMAQVEALGVSGVGAHFDADNDASLAAFGGTNIYLKKDSTLSVFNRTCYKWINQPGDSKEVQAVETYLLSKKYIYDGWFVVIGGGANFEIKEDADQTFFSLLTEFGYTAYGIDLFAGTNITSFENGKQKFLYFGISLD